MEDLWYRVHPDDLHPNVSWLDLSLTNCFEKNSSAPLPTVNYNRGCKMECLHNRTLGLCTKV